MDVTTTQCFILYALRDPRTQEIRYIGKTTQKSSKRLDNHLRAAKLRKRNHRCHWLRELIELGLKPELQVLRDDIQLEEHLNAEEISMIAFCREAGMKLTNATDGGEGLRNPSPETRRKMSMAALGNTKFLGRHHSREALRRMSESQKGKTRTLEFKNKVSLARGGRPFRDQQGKIYTNQRECARTLGLNQRSIFRVLKGLRKSTKGYRFCYLHQSL